MLAFRSSDKGKTWTGPKIAFDIDYSQHGFIPFIPKGSKRIYAFGTQPIPSIRQIRGGVNENCPIGFRYSDDDGHTWSKVTLIKPVNDPDFQGMSCMRMCETDDGTWILGTHEGDWSVSPLATYLYMLRSEDKGKTWTIVPGPHPNEKRQANSQPGSDLRVLEVHHAEHGGEAPILKLPIYLAHLVLLASIYRECILFHVTTPEQKARNLGDLAQAPQVVGGHQ